MSISQAAVSISSAFPIRAADEPPRRPGNGPAFAAALAENRAAASKPPRAAEPTSSDEADAPDGAEAGDEPGPATPATAAEAGEAPDAEQQPDDEAGADTGGDAGPHSSEEQVGSLFLQAALPPRITEASPILVEGTDGRAFAPPLSAAGTAGPGSDPALADLPEMPADSAVDAPAGVRAAQLPFLPAGKDARTVPKIAEEVSAPALVQVSVALSPAAQTSLAIAGFGQGLSVMWTAGRSAPGEGQDTGAETVPDIRDLLRIAPLVNQPVAVTGDEAAANLIETGLAEGGELPLDGVAEVVPLSGGSSGQATAAAPTPAPAAQSAVATPAQLAPLVVTAARQNGPSDITVTLSPAELGTLHMRVSMEGDSLRITLLADRPETLDLLRRNGDQLLADLRDLGFGGASLGFGTSGGGATPAPFDDKDDAADVLPAAAAPQQIPPAPSRVQRAGGLDLRL